MSAQAKMGGAATKTRDRAQPTPLRAALVKSLRSIPRAELERSLRKSVRQIQHKAGAPKSTLVQTKGGLAVRTDCAQTPHTIRRRLAQLLRRIGYQSPAEAPSIRRGKPQPPRGKNQRVAATSHRSSRNRARGNQEGQR